MIDNWIEGLIVRSQSGFHTVMTEQGQYVCRLRGRLKRGPRLGDITAVGDKVLISPLHDGTGAIEEILPRIRELVRLAPTPRGEYRQVLFANLDQVLLVFACAFPEPKLRMLDRFLVICEKQKIPVQIVANKIDLVGLREAKSIFSRYEPIGYPVHYTSTKKSKGLKELKKILVGKVTGLAGPSGVGKSSLLNAIQPELGIAVREVSEATEKGKHTTVVRELHSLNEGGYVADVPGLKSLGLWDIEPEELDGYFPEIRNLVSQCQFNDCIHFDDPGCAVREAVDKGKIDYGRYESYLRMRLGEELEFE
jgi:ribosome biogenesis GTPase